MKHWTACITLLLFVTGFTIVQAQPVINWDDIPGEPGTVITNMSSFAPIPVDIGDAGENVTWNTSTYTATYEQVQTWIAPDESPFGDSFPLANRCMAVFSDTAGLEMYSYYTITQNTYWALGYAFEGQENTIEYESNTPVYHFPTNYGDEWYSTFSFSIGAGIVSYDSTFNEVDAWGTIQDQVGQFECLRVKSQHRVGMTINGVPVYQTTFWNYSWITPEMGMIVSMTSAENDDNPDFTLGVFTRLVSLETAVDEDPTREQPFTISLGEAYPNPFNPETNIPFTLTKNGPVSLVVYDLQGREITTLVQGNLTAGRHVVSFDAVVLPAGTYFARLSNGAFQQTRRLVLVK